MAVPDRGELPHSHQVLALVVFSLFEMNFSGVRESLPDRNAFTSNIFTAFWK
jgi:hypothetical protein